MLGFHREASAALAGLCASGCLRDLLLPEQTQLTAMILVTAAASPSSSFNCSYDFPAWKAERKHRMGRHFQGRAISAPAWTLRKQQKEPGNQKAFQGKAKMKIPPSGSMQGWKVHNHDLHSLLVPPQCSIQDLKQLTRNPQTWLLPAC